MNKRQLLCTFSSDELFKSVINNIVKFYDVYNNQFFVFSNLKNPKEIFITYNIFTDKKYSKFPNTISIHRKKESNTLFTVNAMNQLIKDENEGVFDKNFVVNWKLYSNSLIITGDPVIKVVSINLLEIINKKLLLL